MFKRQKDVFHFRSMICLITFSLGLIMFTGVAMAEIVAKIGNEEYTSLDDAFTAATNNGGTISVLQDTTLTMPLVSVRKNVVVEGNNFIITVGPDTKINVSGEGHLVLNKVVIDGGTTELQGLKESLFTILNNGSALLQNTIIQNRNIGGINTFGSVFQIDMVNSWKHNFFYFTYKLGAAMGTY